MAASPDRWAKVSDRDPTSGIIGAFAVTPHDTNPLADLSGQERVTRRFRIAGSAGDVKVTFAETGIEYVIPSLEAGWHDYRVTHIWSTGTTATTIIAEF